jgi:hypothetical protein
LGIVGRGSGELPMEGEIMGWFLTSSKPRGQRGGKARKSSRNAATRKPWNPQRTLVGLQALALGLAVVGVATAWRYGEQALCHYVARQADAAARHRAAMGRVEGGPEAQAVTVRLDDAPSWMSPRLRETLGELVRRVVDHDPMDQRCLATAVRVLNDNPWVLSVQRVERGPGGVVQVRATYREPLAVIEARDGYHLVDAAAVRLPDVYNREEVRSLGLPMVVGVESAPPSAGRPWQGEQVEAALELARLLVNEPYVTQIRAIDAGQRDALGRVRLALLTDRGMVRWGLPPGSERGIEPDAAVKKRWLDQVYNRYGSIDNGGNVVDIYRAAVWEHPQ